MAPQEQSNTVSGAAASGGRSLQHLYATSLDDTEDRFHRRNGVFYPSGYALLALPEGRVGDAVDFVTQQGLAEQEVTLLRPEQMHQLTDQSQHDAGLLSRIVSAELKQMSVLEQLAETGHHFMLLRSTDDSAGMLQTIGAKAGVSKGLVFHALAVEELPVDKETIPGTSPFGANEVIRSQDSDADFDSAHRPPQGGSR
jgi:predicted ATPase